MIRGQPERHREAGAALGSAERSAPERGGTVGAWPRECAFGTDTVRARTTSPWQRFTITALTLPDGARQMDIGTPLSPQSGGWGLNTPCEIH